MAFLGTVKQLVRLETLKDERLNIHERQVALNDGIIAEKRDIYTEAEERQWNELDSRWNELNREVKELEKLDDGKSVSDIDSTWGNADREQVNMSNRKFDAIKQGAVVSYHPDELRDYIKAADREPVNLRALQADLDVSGGFMVAGEQMAQEIIHALNNFLFFRQFSKMFMAPNSEAFVAPVLDNRLGDVTWTAEIQTGNPDEDLDFERKAWHPHPLARRIKVSKKLVRASAFDIEGLIRDEFAYSVGHVLENAYLNSDGAGAPLGCLVDSPAGITNARDVTSSVSGGFVADDFIDVLGTLKEQYRKNCKWIISRTLETALLKKKDGEGNYLLSPVWSERAPRTLLGIPYYVSEYIGYSAGNYAAILGDFSNYWIVDAMTMDIQVLTELYAEENQVGFICRMETDGQPAHEDAFARLILAS